MDISKLQPTAKVTYQVGLQIVTLEVRYAGADELVDFARSELKTSEKNRAFFYSAITGWDLTDGDKPLPCTIENKEKYLPFILGRQTEDGSVIGWELLAFIRDADNFLKN
jgi:hypothetical protein